MANPMDRIGLDAMGDLSLEDERASGSVVRANRHNNHQHHVEPHQTTAQENFVPRQALQSSPPPERYKYHVRAEEPKGLGSDHLKQLMKQGFSRGLARSLLLNSGAFAERHWVIDNSGSMVIGDGHRIVETSDRKIIEQAVSRWEEIQDTVFYHSQMAALLSSPTTFHLLNDPGAPVGTQEFSVAKTAGGDVDKEIRTARTIMQRAKPTGVTPLTDRIWQLRELVESMAQQLRQSGKRVAIIIATDGLPTDAEGYGGGEVLNEFVQALKSLEGLPVWLVIRLCTDEKKVTSFYNSLDEQLELSLEVLDDFLGEAREVNRFNKWLNYALPLHRCRELGYHDRLLDLIDERPLTKGELRDFCANLFGNDLDIVPDPNLNWQDFVRYVDEQSGLEQHQYDPIRKKQAPWVNLKALQRIYGKGKCTIM